MQELMVLSGNPKRRRGKRKARRSARRGKRRMSALQMKYFGGGARANPKKRRSRRRKARHSVAAGVTRSFRRVRRSASRGGSRLLGGLLRSQTGSLSSPMSMLSGALTGAVGAASVNTILARLPLPAMLMAGPQRYATQGVAAIGLGMLAARFLGAGVATKMAEGALTVTLHQALVELAGRAGVTLGGMGYYLPGMRAPAIPNGSGSASRQVAGLGKYVTGPGAGGNNVTALRRGVGAINSFKF